jgi:hypothetical protein
MHNLVIEVAIMIAERKLQLFAEFAGVQEVLAQVSMHSQGGGGS